MASTGGSGETLRGWFSLPYVLATATLLGVASRLFAVVAKGEVLSRRTARLAEWVAILLGASLLLRWLRPVFAYIADHLDGREAHVQLTLMPSDLGFLLLAIGLIVFARIQRIAVARSLELDLIL